MDRRHAVGRVLIRAMTRHEAITQARLYALRGSALPQAKLTEDDVREIRRNPRGLTAKQLAGKHGVHFRTIEKIRYYETWVHV